MAARFLPHWPGAGLALALVTMVQSSLAAQRVDVWSRPVQVERNRICDFLHYRVSLTFDLDTKVFAGENRITLTPFADGLDRFELDTEELTIKSARDNEGRELSLERSDTSVFVLLPRPISFGDTVEFTVAYQGAGSREGFFFDDASDDHHRWCRPIPGQTKHTTGSRCTTTRTTR